MAGIAVPIRRGYGARGKTSAAFLQPDVAWTGDTFENLSGVIPSVSAFSGAVLGTEVGLVGTIPAVSALAPGLGVALTLASTDNAVSTLAGDLNAVPGLAGAVAALSAASGQLDGGTVDLFGAVDAVSTLAGAIDRTQNMTGQVVALSGVGLVRLIIGGTMSGSVNAVSVTPGTLALGEAFVGQIVAASAVDGTLVLTLRSTGAVSGVSGLAADLDTGHEGVAELLVGVTTGVSTLAGDLSGAAEANTAYLDVDWVTFAPALHADLVIAPYLVADAFRVT